MATFIQRLQDEYDGRPQGQKGTLATEAGLNQPHLSTILSEQTAHPATMIKVLHNLGWTIEHDGFVVGPVVESATQP